MLSDIYAAHALFPSVVVGNRATVLASLENGNMVEVYETAWDWLNE